MKRWKNKLAAALLISGGLAGCKQQLYMTIDDQRAVSVSGLPKNIDNDPGLTTPPSAEGHGLPGSVDDPDRPVHYMTLAECFAIALETGTRGNTAPYQILQQLNRGLPSFVTLDDLGSFTYPGGFNGDDAIRAFAMDPAFAGADVEGALAKFDAQWLSSMQWNKVDIAQANAFTGLTNGDTAQFSSGLYKPLPTGGIVGITFNTDYTKLTAPPAGFQVVNPAYQPSATINFEQPLLQNYGVEINQLLPSHPGSTQIAGYTPAGTRNEGIVVQRIRTEQTRADFERSVNVMLFNVETVYWSLYANYFALYAAEQGLRQAYLTYQLRDSEFKAGKSTAHEVAQVRAQFAAFRVQRIQALESVLESERELRSILGMKPVDGNRLVPADAPTLAAYKPDWSSALSDALNKRPELIIAREDVKANQLKLLLAENNIRPDLRFFSSYGANSIGTTLDGSQPNNAFSNLSSDKFNNYTLGLRLNYVLGMRDANASLRQAHLTLARSYVVLTDQEKKAEAYLVGVYQILFSTYRQIEANREQRLALAEQLKGLYARIQAGKDSLITILTAQQQFAAALSAEYTAIANYNVAIAGIQYAKGTLMQYNNIQVADAALPGCTLERARDHLRKRTDALIVAERETVPDGSGTPDPLPRLLMHQPAVPPEPQVGPAPGNGLMMPDANSPTPTMSPPASLPSFGQTPAPQGMLPSGAYPINR